MDDAMTALAQRCLDSAEANTMTFPQIVGALSEAGFEGYAIDFRRGSATYYCPDGDSVSLPMRSPGARIAAAFDTPAIQAAIREAQHQVAGYTYNGFCRKVTQAGCAGYIVSFPGRRALYFGRTAETHTEHFPQ